MENPHSISFADEAIFKYYVKNNSIPFLIANPFKLKTLFDLLKEVGCEANEENKSHYYDVIAQVRGMDIFSQQEHPLVKIIQSIFKLVGPFTDETNEIYSNIIVKPAKLEDLNQLLKAVNHLFDDGEKSVPNYVTQIVEIIFQYDLPIESYNAFLYSAKEILGPINNETFEHYIGFIKKEFVYKKSEQSVLTVYKNCEKNLKDNADVDIAKNNDIHLALVNAIVKSDNLDSVSTTCEKICELYKNDFNIKEHAHIIKYLFKQLFMVFDKIEFFELNPQLRQQLSTTIKNQKNILLEKPELLEQLITTIEKLFQTVFEVCQSCRDYAYRQKSIGQSKAVEHVFIKIAPAMKAFEKESVESQCLKIEDLRISYLHPLGPNNDMSLRGIFDFHTATQGLIEYKEDMISQKKNKKEIVNSLASFHFFDEFNVCKNHLLRHYQELDKPESQYKVMSKVQMLKTSIYSIKKLNIHGKIQEILDKHKNDFENNPESFENIIITLGNLSDFLYKCFDKHYPSNNVNIEEMFSSALENYFLPAITKAESIVQLHQAIDQINYRLASYIQPVSSDIKTPLSLFISIFNEDDSSKTIDEKHQIICQFIQKIDKINSRCNNEVMIDIKSLLIHNDSKLSFMANSLGVSIFQFLQGFIKTSVKPLSHFLDTVTRLPEFSNFFWNDESIKHYFNQIKHWEDRNSFIEKLSICILVYSCSNNKDKKFFENIRMHAKSAIENRINPKQSIVSMLSFLDDYLLKQIKAILSSDKDDFTIEQAKPILPIIDKLAQGIVHSSTHKDAFIQLINTYLDMNSHQAYQAFAFDGIKNSTISQQLASHNKKIIQSLKSLKIITDKVFNYTKTRQFFSGNSNDIDYNLRSKAIWSYVKQLYFAIQSYSHTQTETNKSEVIKSKAINDIKVNIAKLHKQVTTQTVASNESFIDTLNELQLKKLEKDNIRKLLSNIVSNGENFNQHSDRNKAKDRSICEFIGHINQHFSVNQKIIASDHKIKKVKKLIAKIWDKNDINTFMLGNFLSCCLATDNSQFNAMIERWLDAAMFMPVIIDTETNEPVCGAWMFFATNKNNPKKLYMVANFLEIRSSYANETSMREKLVAQLLDFIGQFARDIGVEFLIRPLTYGMIHDVDFFDSIDITLDKVGGFFNPKGSETDYYLCSLQIDKFYQFNQQKCHKRFPEAFTKDNNLSAAPVPRASFFQKDDSSNNHNNNNNNNDAEEYAENEGFILL